jgi:hypothetical protein
MNRNLLSNRIKAFFRVWPGEDLVVVGSLQIPLNPPFLRGEISHIDLDETTIKADPIYKTGGLEIKDTLRKCQQENEGCRIVDKFKEKNVVLPKKTGQPAELQSIEARQPKTEGNNNRTQREHGNVRNK